MSEAIGTITQFQRTAAFDYAVGEHLPNDDICDNGSKAGVTQIVRFCSGKALYGIIKKSFAGWAFHGVAFMSLMISSDSFFERTPVL